MPLKLRPLMRITNNQRRTFVSNLVRFGRNNSYDRLAQQQTFYATLPPLTDALPNLAKPIFASDDIATKHQFGPTQISKLENGCRVITEPKFGQSATVGIVIEAGSRYEVAYPSGICHLLEKLAFNSTLYYRNQDELVDVADRYSAVWDAQCSRDLFIYAANVRIDGVHQIMSLIADTAWRPIITDEEFARAKEVTQFDTYDMSNRPDTEAVLTDWLHGAAFRGNTLGLPKFCNDTHPINKEHLFAYLSRHFTPHRICVVGIGVEHSTLVESAIELFVNKPPIWQSEPNRLPNKVPEIDNSLAQYTGGEMRHEKDLSQIGAGTPYPNLAHMMIGLNGVSYLDSDYIPMCVLNSLMGGGNHFSSGGPGKGMYTRLFTDVLNRYHWMYNCISYNHAYQDNGLYCIQASADPAQLLSLVRVVTETLIRMTKGFNTEEIARAKAQLKSMLLMNLEMRPVQFEDTARVVIALGRRKTPMEFIDDINKVTEKDLLRVAERLLSSRPSFVAYGDLDAISKMPFELLEEAFTKRDTSIISPKSSFFFGDRSKA